ncbi:tyrosine-type recombinase/integrase [Jeongeupia naejangsanensis]|uniref:Tyrosine-type recombinase/integrase n=1 Tax=Jeongeupia naejangsanensis TaxID=613195 RepID=A0ABS2BQI5_9NEIS|nr:tyrosine-type recombinase/integrase [Jeongeupia naejangsanensis]MBM3117892.1 tyrosine-type recombinase/integrase [Jeongeupia naejangsanensis]
MALTELQCQKAKPKASDYSLADADGLYLLVRATGGRSWKCDFVVNGKRHKPGLGKYPAISLAEARKLLAAARRLAERGQKPGDLLAHDQARALLIKGKSLEEAEAELAHEQEAAVQALRMTFTEAAERYKTGWVDQAWKNPDKGFAPVRTHLLPKLADLPLDDIDAPMLRELFYDIRERRGVQAALHAHGWATRVFSYAQEHDWCATNPAQQIKAARIGSKGKRNRWLTTPEIRRYLIGLYQADCYRGYKLALHLLLMLALRKNELCGASWQEFDFDAGEWLIPASRMKAGKEHRVFLPRQAIEMLVELQRLGHGSEWVMPMPTNPKRAMNGNNLDGAHAAAITSAKIDDYVIHDHRHTASTQLREQGHMPEVVEAALSHAIPGIAGVYAHAQYKTQRLAMLQAWADFLDNTMNEQTIIAATFRKQA